MMKKYAAKKLSVDSTKFFDYNYEIVNSKKVLIQNLGGGDVELFIDAPENDPITIPSGKDFELNLEFENEEK